MTDNESDPQPTFDRDAMVKMLADAVYLADDLDLDRDAMNLGRRAIEVVHRRLTGEGASD